MHFVTWSTSKKLIMSALFISDRNFRDIDACWFGHSAITVDSSYHNALLQFLLSDHEHAIRAHCSLEALSWIDCVLALFVCFETLPTPLGAYRNANNIECEARVYNRGVCCIPWYKFSEAAEKERMVSSLLNMECFGAGSSTCSLRHGYPQSVLNCFIQHSKSQLWRKRINNSSFKLVHVICL